MGYCSWADINEITKTYHDNEWGIPVHDDQLMFEHLSLECLQCGLSWGLIMKKRDIFRKCFDDFNYENIANYNEDNIAKILNHVYEKQMLQDILQLFEQELLHLMLLF